MQTTETQLEKKQATEAELKKKQTTEAKLKKTDNRGRVEGNMLMAELILFPLILIVRSCSSMEQGDKEKIKLVLNIIVRRT